jgi:ubiquinone/menaquinone biosynthesis C-methylase UbiE
MKRGSGRYPIESRQGEFERLRMQAEAMSFDAAVMLDRVGVGAGWRCLDLGCGVGGITDLLWARAGPSGRVVGLDSDPTKLEAARAWARAQGLDAVEFVEDDAYRSRLPRASFDLVHVRFLFSTAGQIDALLAEALALTRPGGVLAVQEPDIDTLNCYPPHPAWTRLKTALEGVFDAIGGDVRLAQRLYRLLRAAGLVDVAYRPFLVGVTSDQAMADYLPQTIESVRSTILDQGLLTEPELDEAIAACRAHLADPDTVSTSYLVAEVWGRKPGERDSTREPVAPAAGGL